MARALTAQSSFVGRRSELVRLGALLRTVRLVTLVGPAGVGKTRLALELARRVDPGLLGVAELAPLRDASQVGVAAAAGFGLGATADAAAIGRWLAGRPALLVLDNCEHLAAASASVVTSLLDAAPGLRVIATSREPLDVGGEHLWTVTPLSLPAANDRPLRWQRADAVRLFIDRARQVAPTFPVDDQSAAAVVAICRTLEGIPLAIELAARRVRSLSLDDLQRGLREPLQMLRALGGPRSGRHDAMRNAIDWSQRLLSEEERRVFRRLSVFDGGLTYVADLLAAHDPGRDQRPMVQLAKTHSDHANVRAGVEWLLANDIVRARRALSKAWLIYVFLRPGIDPAEIERWLERALDGDTAPDTRAAILVALSQRRFARGDLNGSRGAAEEAVRVAEANGVNDVAPGGHHRVAIALAAAGETSARSSTSAARSTATERRAPRVGPGHTRSAEASSARAGTPRRRTRTSRPRARSARDCPTIGGRSR